MDTPDRPPPKVFGSPPGETVIRSRSRKRVVWIVVPVAMLLLIYSIYAVGIRMERASLRVDAITSASEIRHGLLEFSKEYGGYPGPRTIDRLRAATATTVPLGTTSSNEYFRQLLVYGVGDEELYYIPSKHALRPDGRMNGAEALKKRECGFAYVVGLKADDDDSLPLVLGPVIPGTNRFDHEALNGHAVVISVGGSHSSISVRKDGKLDLGKGVILDPAKPEWKGIPLHIAWPE